MRRSIDPRYLNANINPPNPYLAAVPKVVVADVVAIVVEDVVLLHTGGQNHNTNPPQPRFYFPETPIIIP